MTVHVIYVLCVCLCMYLLVILFFSHPNPGGCLLIFVIPWQQMQRRSDRIRDRCERATERQVHEEEEPVAPRPRGRQNRGNHNRKHGLGQPQDDNIQNIEDVLEEDEEVEQNIGNEPVQGEEPPPPPPTLAEVMDRQTWLFENLVRR